MTLRDFLRQRLCRGPVSVPMAACDAKNAGALPEAIPVPGYGLVRRELDAMATAGEAQKWPDHDCWSLPASAQIEKNKEPS